MTQMNPLSGSCIPQLDAPLIELCAKLHGGMLNCSRSPGSRRLPPMSCDLGKAAFSCSARPNPESKSNSFSGLGFFVTSQVGSLGACLRYNLPGTSQHQVAPGAMDGTPQVMMQHGQGMRSLLVVKRTVPANASMGHGPSREQALQQRVADLEEALRGKDQEIKELQTALSRAGIKLPSSFAKKAKAREKVGSGGFRKVSQSQPAVPYEAIDQEDPIDLRLEEFYNGTGSAIPFQRINRGFYRFGETILELNIINHKLMARTEDGWNRSKFGPIEKFLMYYENIEREKAELIWDGDSNAPGRPVKHIRLGATNNGIPLPVKNTFIDVPSGLTPSAMKLDTPYNPLLTAPADLNHAPGFLQRTLVSVTGALPTPSQSSPQGGLLPISPAAVIHRRVMQSPVATPVTPSPSGAKWAKSAGCMGGTTAIPACVIAAPSPTRALAISSTTCTTEATQQAEPLDDDEEDDSGSDQVVPVHLRNPEDAPRAPAGAKHPSLGSEGHDEGGCKRCCFFPRGRCTNGYNCEFCHYEHEKRKRKNKKKIKKKDDTPMAGAMFHSLDLRPPQMPPAQVPPAPLVLSQALPMQACVQSYAGYPPEADRPVKPLLSVQPVQTYAGPPAEQAVPGQHIIYGPTVGATDGPMQAVPTIVMTSQPSQQMPAQPVVAQQHLPPPPAQTMPAHMVPTAPAPLPPHTVPSMQTMPHTAPSIPPMPHAAHTLAQTMPAQQLPPVGTLPPHIPPHMVTHATAPAAAFSPYQYPYQAAPHHQAYGGVLDPTPPPPMQSPKLGQAGFQAYMMPPPMGSPRLPMDMRPMLGMQAAA
ncbi:unnamed protein product [Symbiodinium sp. CCMP2456]|nr:unnamed protein product [Symbiodinium sp. CCMP2456]